MSLAPSTNLTFQKFHCTVARGFSPQHRSPSSLLQETIHSAPSVGSYMEKEALPNAGLYDQREVLESVHRLSQREYGRGQYLGSVG